MNQARILMFVLGLFVTAACGAHGGDHYHGGGGGGGGDHYHGGGGDHYHGGNGHYYHGGGGGGGYYHDGGGWNGPGIVIGIPFGGYYGPGYYGPPPCQTIRVCDQYSDECWLEQAC